jgi:hypothetical protein
MATVCFVWPIGSTPAPLLSALERCRRAQSVVERFLGK